MSVIAAVQ